MSEEPKRDEDSARAALGSMLRYLRGKSGKSLGQLAEDTRYDRSYLYRLEAAERVAKRPVMEDLDKYYGTDDLLVRLWKLARMEAFVDHYKEFMRLENTANVMHLYTPNIPGLLQTEAYARGVLALWPDRSEEELEEQVAARLGRQELLHRKPAPTLRVIIDEAALRRTLADLRVCAEQLDQLLTSAALPSITVQVLPFSAGTHPSIDGSFSVLWQPDGSPTAYVEGSGSAQLFADQQDILRYRLAYDQIRDLALSPPDSARFIKDILEEYSS